jgi:sigma-B regulation protein RsbU (phosphoserine phosphatase)
VKILVAEDDAVARHLLNKILVKQGYDVELVTNGSDAWDSLQRPDAPPLAILDWMMPGMHGVEVCRRVREDAGRKPTYVILLTARHDKEDVVTGLVAGADDYVTKPFNASELCARIAVGLRVLRLQTELEARIDELEAALSKVKRLEGLLPICSYCKNIRDDQNYWHQVDSYVSEHADVQFTHGICPSCYEKLVSPMLEERQRRDAEAGDDPWSQAE